MLAFDHDMSDHLYNPTNHLSQTELMEKFNLAFYEGQNLSRTDILKTINDCNHDDDYFNSYIDEPPLINEPFDNSDVFFNFGDLICTFDQSTSITNTPSTITTSSEATSEPNYLQTVLDLDLDLDLDLETLSNSSLDLDGLELQGLDVPKTHTDLEGDFGHLLSTSSNWQINSHHNHHQSEVNHEIISQNDNLLQDSAFFTANDYDDDAILIDELSSSESSSSCLLSTLSSSSSPRNSLELQCQWEDCYQIYDSQLSLVKHIEKCHVEVKRGDEFTCYWANCPRKIKPFNARYKLLIHMRVHSGEKPNKCPFQGCNKAFSRLENLKIHQRSHTGERPYLCQFPTCNKSFSNSSDRAKHQRTHFDTKPYACQVYGCLKKYTDPSSLRKHVKNHTAEEQLMLKKKSMDELNTTYNLAYTKQFLDPNRQKAIKGMGGQNLNGCDSNNTKKLNNHTKEHIEHNYSHIKIETNRKLNSNNIRQDLKNKISEKQRYKKNFCC